MKFKYYLGIALVLLNLSCSGDSSGNDTEPNVELRVKELNDAGPFSLYFWYHNDSADCDRIVNLTNNEYYYNFYYDTNNLLSSRFAFNEEYRYEYVNGQVSAEIELFITNILNKKMFYYNADNLLSKIEYYTYSNGVGYSLLRYEIYTYDSQNNVSRCDYYEATDPTTPLQYTLYTYDTKKNPFRNFNQKVTILQFRPYGNNVLTEKTFDANNELLGEATFTYQYNDADYPIAKTSSYSNGDVSTLYFTYY